MSDNQKIIDALEAKKRVIDDEIKLLDDKNAKQLTARKLLKENSDKKKSRKIEDRKKFIIGAVVLKEIQRNPSFKIEILEFLNHTVKADRDRIILGLGDTKQTNKQTNK